MNPSLIILAAGVGSRLGRHHPKCLYELPGGETILARQIRQARACGIENILVVVGFKFSLIMEQYPDVLYCYNPYYHITNTSKSLLAALRLCGNRDVVWMNGDVVCDPEVLEGVVRHPGNVVAVDRKRCGEEEVKYRSQNGRLAEISKTVAAPEGESLGVQKVCAPDVPALLRELEACADNDYFERGIQSHVDHGGLWGMHDIGSARAIEVDFEDDWKAAQSQFGLPPA